MYTENSYRYYDFVFLSLEFTQYENDVLIQLRSRGHDYKLVEGAYDDVRLAVVVSDQLLR